MKLRCLKWMPPRFGRRDGARCRCRGAALALFLGFLLAGCGKVDLGQWANMTRGGETQGSATGRRQVVGSPTSDLNAVRRNVEQAKRT